MGAMFIILLLLIVVSWVVAAPLYIKLGELIDKILKPFKGEDEDESR